MSRTAILYVTERCNQACVFCLEEDGLALRPDLPPAQVCSDLAELRARGAHHLTFMGGETFLRKDLPDLLAEARRVGFTRLGVTTNGTALSHPGFLERMIASGLDFVEMSVHSDDAALAEAISGKAFTWERQQKALAELESLRDRLHVIVNVVICRENHLRVEAILREMLDAFPRLRPVVKLKLVSVIGAADREGQVPLTYSEVDLVPALRLLRERGIEHWLYNFPLCRMPEASVPESHEAQAFVLDWQYHDYDHRKRDGYYESGFQLEGNVWPDRSCGGCTLAPLCPGVEETYRRRHGEGELATRSLPALPVVEAILRQAGQDPGIAPARLSELEARPRPSRFAGPLEPKPGEAALVFQHPDWEEPLAFELGPADGRRAFKATPRFALGYRRAAREPGADPAGAILLSALERALQEADAAGEVLALAARRLAASADQGWSCRQVRLGPAPPDASVPIAIRVPARRREAAT